LVVEDDQDIRDLVTLQLDRAGYETQSVSDGAEAMAAVREQSPDLVIMDLRTSGTSGIEAARGIRDGGFTAPIVALSASRDAAEIEGALAAGFSDYLFKPLDKHELVAAVERALTQQQ
jgi:CheY-like chemotaxis protein